MASKVIMPQGGQDLTHGRVVRWLKKEGESVSKGELICEAETEKAVFEVAAPQDGLLLKIIARDGEEVEILSTIGYVGQSGEKIAKPEGLSEEKKRHEEKVAAERIAESPTAGLKRPKKIISPKARKLARDNNLQLTDLRSSRADGKITTEDVLKALEDKMQASGGKPAGLARMTSLGRIRKASARRLSQSWATAPHIFVTVAVDMTDVLQIREDLKQTGIKITDLIIRACALALNEFPEVNASLIDEDTIGIWDDINIGVAVETPHGLLVPVIENADKLVLPELAAHARMIFENARSGKLGLTKPSRFTISNLGMHQVDNFTAVINPPEAAILAVSTIRKTPWVGIDDSIVVRQMMNLTLSMDHRVGDGVLAAKFINAIKARLEAPETLR